MRRKSGLFLRYGIDVISVVVVLISLGVQLTAYYWEWPWYAAILTVILMRWAHLVQHNHAHLPLFHQPYLNQPFGWLLCLNGGVPMEIYRLQHVRNHHVHLNRDQDWTSPFHFEGARYPTRPTKWLYYVLTYTLISLLHCLIWFLRHPRHPETTRYLVALALVGSVCAYLLVRDPRAFILFFVLTWLATYIGVPINNWDHHADCDYSTVYTSANVDVRAMCTWLGFNIGYHSAHHANPGLHWSLLPEYHKKVFEPRVPLTYYRWLKPRRSAANEVPAEPRTQGDGRSQENAEMDREAGLVRNGCLS